jgi:hypothetical protein
MLGSSQTKLHSAKGETTFTFRHSCGLFQRTPALAVKLFGRCLSGAGLPNWSILPLMRMPESS